MHRGTDGDSSTGCDAGEMPPAPRRIAWEVIVLQVGLTVYLIGATALAVLIQFREVGP